MHQHCHRRWTPCQQPRKLIYEQQAFNVVNVENDCDITFDPSKWNGADEMEEARDESGDGLIEEKKELKTGVESSGEDMNSD